MKIRIHRPVLFLLLLLGFNSQAADLQSQSQYNNVLFKSTISEKDGKDVQIREAFFPPDWKAPRHYHNSNLFIYVIEGEFEVELHGSDRVVYRAGDALQMNSGIEMEARNASSTKPLKLAVFQVGNPSSAFVVPVQ